MGLSHQVITSRLRTGLRFPVSGEVVRGDVVCLAVTSVRSEADGWRTRTIPLSVACIRTLLADSDRWRLSEDRVLRFPCSHILDVDGYPGSGPLDALPVSDWWLGRTRRIVGNVFSAGPALCAVTEAVIPTVDDVLFVGCFVEAVDPGNLTHVRQVAISRAGGAAIAADPGVLDAVEGRISDIAFEFSIGRTYEVPARCRPLSPCGC